MNTTIANNWKASKGQKPYCKMVMHFQTARTNKAPAESAGAFYF